MAHQQCSRFISHSAQAFSTTSLAARAELPGAKPHPPLVARGRVHIALLCKSYCSHPVTFLLFKCSTRSHFSEMNASCVTMMQILFLQTCFRASNMPSADALSRFAVGSSSTKTGGRRRRYAPRQPCGAGRSIDFCPPARSRTPLFFRLQTP